MPDPKHKFIGRSVPRLEDRPLLTGRGRFAAERIEFVVENS